MGNLSFSKLLMITNPPMITFFIFILLTLQHLFTIGVTSYKPVENFAVNCGFSGNSNSNSRNWTGDINSKIFSPVEPQSHHSVTPHSASVNSIPYGTARLSRFEFTYSFPVTDGQKFIRLHFFPASYLNFDRSNSLFSVRAGPYTLLKDFNASLTADNDNNPEETITREYCINVEPGQRLNLTFTPSPTHPDAYAFINGFEIVSMPTDLYYSKPYDQELRVVNQNLQMYQISNNTALETVYRINVGGAQIPPNKDTGMFRNWDDDVTYVDVERERSIAAGFALQLKNNGQNDSAPDAVYLTARTYGMNATSNYNLTWEFEVDSGFFYMVRLHFCEFEQQIQTTGQRVFQIFIADNLAERLADVIMWSGGNLIPVYKDYAVFMVSKASFKNLNLSIKLQRHPNEKLSDYDNVILNGIEIFKVNDSNGNLGGPNPDSTWQPLVPLSEPSGKSKKKKIVPIVLGVGSGILLLSVIGFLIFRRLNIAGKSSWGESKSSKTLESSLPSDLCRNFSVTEIRAATNNFDDVLVIGVGGFGNVYKGYIDEGTTPVAIKRLKPGSQQGAHEFKTEVEMLSQLRHLHLVSLIGYCNDSNEMILVYDFMACGTLRDHLYDSGNPPLSWKQRLEICLGAARGLNYLHTGLKHNIIHRDIKTTNILLDEKWVAKVSDFGLSKFGPIGMSRSHVSTVVKGSVGYLDPEYYKRQRLTLKSDVYSFGVVLLEVLCARQPVLRTVEKQQASLVQWVRKCHENGEIDQTVDPFLKGTITPECLNKYVDMAFNCLLDDGNQRPSMNDVVWGLEFAMQLQESMEGTVVSKTEVETKCKERALLKNITNDDDVESNVLFTSTDESSNRSKASKMSTGSSEDHSLVSRMVFSELLDPTKR
ncbi:hypothetical protein L6164_037379 [Bauhinia variegata]|uniref:Uncharacterized protein n=1 Tax=Bauhinia variegata TaxID=167791 RepID=A0ACB9KJQ1_BAUVA|nr:hypothetical protein L6164_037379 [Bauhinia variegata]